MSVWSLNTLEHTRQDARELYLEFLREPAISAGLYTLEAGSTDLQSPHTEDEIYVVLEGRAKILIGTKDFEVNPGDTIFVPALLEHRFHSILETLKVIVVFAPASCSRRQP
jgi:mannose-6-phosphate isomerase-like protein (cupin superfamily)